MFRIDARSDSNFDIFILVRWMYFNVSSTFQSMKYAKCKHYTIDTLQCLYVIPANFWFHLNWWLRWQNWIIIGGRFSNRTTGAVIVGEHYSSRQYSQFLCWTLDYIKTEDPNHGREIIYIVIGSFRTQIQHQTILIYN